VGAPVVAAYAAGQMFYFVATGDNTGAVTLNIDSLGAKAVTRDGSVALAAGDIKSGEVVVVVYDGTRFQVVSQLNSAGDARFANVSIASSLYVGGVSTFVGNAGFSANVSIASALSVGGVAAITGATTIGGNLTLNGGTANGVLYLNGSKVATSGSALTFDGTNFTVGVSATTGDYKTFIQKAGSELLGLNASSGTLARIAFGNTTATFGSTQIIANAADLAFITNSAEQMRLTSTGLGIGTSSPGGRLGLAVASSGTFQNAIVASNGVDSDFVLRIKTTETNIANTGVLAALTFSTNSTERARITSGGLFQLNQSSDTNYLFSNAAAANLGGALVQASTAGYAAIQGIHSSNSATGYCAYFNNSGSATGLYISNTAAWQSTSDERLKTDIKDLNVTGKFMQLRPRDYLWKSQETSDAPNKRNFGFIAQEVQTIFPDLVGVSPDGMLSVEYTGFIAPLVKAIQEQQEMINELKAKVAALETK
jgi:hypothetical protein